MNHESFSPTMNCSDKLESNYHNFILKSLWKCHLQKVDHCVPVFPSWNGWATAVAVVQSGFYLKMTADISAQGCEMDVTFNI